MGLFFKGAILYNPKKLTRYTGTPIVHRMTGALSHPLYVRVATDRKMLVANKLK